MPKAANYDPSSKDKDGVDGKLVIGCLSTHGLLLELTLSDLSIQSNFTYFYGDYVKSIIMAPLKSYTFVGGSPDHPPFHLVTLHMNSGPHTLYTSLELNYQNPTTASSNGESHGLLVFGHDVLLFDLAYLTNTPVDANYLNNVIGTSSVYSYDSSTVVVSTNSSVLYFYSIPTPMLPSSALPMWLLVIILIVSVLLVLFIGKIIYSYYQFKKRRESYHLLQ
eukprot:gene13446-15848_t